MKQGELNTYADAGTPDDPYTETCKDCLGDGCDAAGNGMCGTCDGAGVVECERPSDDDGGPYGGDGPDD